MLWRKLRNLNHILKSSRVHSMEVESERDMGTFMVEKGHCGHPRKAAMGR